MWNLFKVNNKDSRTTSTDFIDCSGVDFEQLNAAGESAHYIIIDHFVTWNGPHIIWGNAIERQIYKS